MDINLLYHVKDRLDHTRFESERGRVLPLHAEVQNDTIVLTVQFGAGGTKTYRLTAEKEGQ